MKNISNPAFVAKLLIVKETCAKVSLLEKEAQSETFGPFQFMNLIEKFRRLLVVSDLPHDVKNLSNGVFEYNFSEKADVQFDSLHFHELKIPAFLPGAQKRK